MQLRSSWSQRQTRRRRGGNLGYEPAYSRTMPSRCEMVTNLVTANPPEGRQRLAHPELLRVKTSIPKREPVIDDEFHAGTYLERRGPADLELYIDGPQRRGARGLLHTKTTPNLRNKIPGRKAIGQGAQDVDYMYLMKGSGTGTGGYHMSWNYFGAEGLLISPFPSIRPSRG